MSDDAAIRTPDIAILDLHDEPTVLDVDLGVRLGMTRPTNIRQTIQKNLEELRSYGTLHAPRATSQMPRGGAKTVTEYHLTEPQALCVCALSRAPNAPAARRMLIEAFLAYRHGRRRLADKQARLRHLEIVLKGWGIRAFQEEYAAMGYPLRPAMMRALDQPDLFARRWDA